MGSFEGLSEFTIKGDFGKRVMQVSSQTDVRSFLHDLYVFPPNPPVCLAVLNSFLICFSFRNDVTSGSDVTFACLPVSWTAKGSFKINDD